jgi:general secretion pathway protein D
VVNHRRGVGANLAAGAFIALLGCGLLGCDLTSHTTGEGPGQGQNQHVPDPSDVVQKMDLSPRFPDQTQQPSAVSPRTQGYSYYGADDEKKGKPLVVQEVASGDEYELNFENTAVATVAKVILGDILKVGYIIDPRVQGTVTLASGRPIPKSALISTLENALRMSNVVLLADRNGTYRLVPSGDAQGAAGVVSREDGARGGYGISVVPLHYTSSQTILKLLDGFAVKAGVARADKVHNLILVQGSSPDRKAVVDTILTFDVDWMRGQSVGVYPLENATPDEMIKELDKILDRGEQGVNQSLVTLQPITRLNAVLVVTRRPSLLKQAALWIKRLDQANNAGASVHVYRLRYGDARQIAHVLGDLFGNRQRGLNSAVNQLAPGAGAAVSSSGFGTNQNTGGFFGNGTNQTPGSGSTMGTPSMGAPNTGGSTPGGGTGGIQLGNLGSGFGNPQGVGSTPGASTNIASGAFGRRTAQDDTAIVLPGMRIAADVTNNSLVIYASQENYRLIERTLAQLDKPQLQVAIHATIAEVTLNNDLQFGVEYYLNNGAVSFNTQASTSSSTPSTTTTNATTGVTTTTTGTTTPVSSVLSAVLPGGNFLLGPTATPSVVINALRTVTDVKVLSSPSVVVLDNQVATLLVGDQVPVQTQSAAILTNANTPIVNSINYINTGVILQARPRINANGTVILDVEQEVSGVTNSTAQSLTPTVSQRQIASSISVASGQTVLLGGLITETQQRTRMGIPVLEEIPAGIGNLFSTNDRSTQRTEIIVFIEPQIIRNSVDAAKVAEELRAKMRGSVNSAFQRGPSLFSDPHFAQ